MTIATLSIEISPTPEKLTPALRRYVAFMLDMIALEYQKGEHDEHRSPEHFQIGTPP